MPHRKEFETQRDVVQSIASLPFPFPRSSKELFAILAHFDPSKGIDHLLSCIDMDHVLPSDITSIVLGRFPGSAGDAVAGPDFNARSLLKDVLLAEESRRLIVRTFLDAFPHLRRSTFIHVPKCAGTDLILNLAQRHLPLPVMIGLPDWVSNDDFLQVIAGLARVAPFREQIFIYGHIELGEYVDLAGLRPADHLFTIIRDPLELMVSQANYAVGRLRQDPMGNDPDTAETLRLLDLPRLPVDVTNQALKDLTLRALLHPEVTAPNRACTYLGRGNSGTYDVAIDCLVRYNVEITTTGQYHRWLQERWNIDASSRHNASDPILTPGEVRRFYGGAVKGAIREDHKLYDVITWALETTGRSSITGQELGRLAEGPEMARLFEMARSVIASGTGAGLSWADRDLLVAHQTEYVERYLHQTAINLAGISTFREVVSIDSRLDHNHENCCLNGWSSPEPEFTWTNGTESRLSLPALSPEKSYLLRLIGSPFVVRNLLPKQRLDVLVNNVPIGFAEFKETAVIECPIPGRILVAGEPVIVTLQMPRASRPKDLGRSEDDRLLGFAMRRVVVLEVEGSD